MPNIYDVAARAGVSIATVSRVRRGVDTVAPGTRERVLAAIHELGYRPSRLAAGLASGSHGATGIVFPTLSGPYYGEVIRGFEERVIAEGQSLVILGTHARPRAGELVLELARRVDGLTIMGRTVPDDVVGALARDGFPVVLLARPPVADVPAVRAENVQAAGELTSHLFGHGHRRLAFLGDPESSPDAYGRWQGFVSAHRDAGLRPAGAPVRTEFREAGGFAAARRLLARRPRPTALVCGNDEIAFGAYRAAEDLALRVPEDVAVTGWDDISLARYLSPPLTTVQQPLEALGAEAARLLFERIRGGSPDNVLLSTRLVLRASCGCEYDGKRGWKEGETQ